MTASLLALVLGFGVGFGFGCWFAKLSTMSAPGLDRPDVLAAETIGANFGLDQSPPVDGAVLPGLRLLCVYILLDPELMVRRALLFQFL